MNSVNLCYTNFACFLVILVFNHVYAGRIERVVIIGNESSILQLTCHRLTTTLAILEANFYPEYNDSLYLGGGLGKDNGTLPDRHTVFLSVHPRQALNKRCSGLNHCSFILTEDCPGADDWGPGILNITYACVPDDLVEKYCNRDIILPQLEDLQGVAKKVQRYSPAEGFIQNPGYPRFYSGRRRCRWKIRAHPEQRIWLTVLDLAITAPFAPPFSPCLHDRLDITDSATGRILLSTCSPAVGHQPLQLVTPGSEVEVSLLSRYVLNPGRGLLLHYRPVGCVTPPPPLNGYMVARDEMEVEYSCYLGGVFPDTGMQRRRIRCEGWRWTGTVPDCEKIPDVFVEPVGVGEIGPSSASMDTELLPPIFLILLLFILNLIALFFINKKKKSQVTEFTDEELGVLSS